MQLEAIKTLLMAQDMDRAVGFYRDVIGLEGTLVTPHWSELTRGDTILALHGGGDGSFRETGVSFQVADVEAACAEVVAGGGTLRKEPQARPGEPIKLAEVTDPEGNGFMLTEYVG